MVAAEYRFSSLCFLSLPPFPAIILLVNLTEFASRVQGCKKLFGGSDADEARRGRAFLTSSSLENNNAVGFPSSTTRVKIHNLNREGDVMAVTHARVYEGDQYYGRYGCGWFTGMLGNGMYRW